MITQPHPNWERFSEAGIVPVTSLNGNALAVHNLTLPTAAKLGRSLMDMLDGSSRPSYGSLLTIEVIEAIIQKRFSDNRDDRVFGEVRPGDRNFALSICTSFRPENRLAGAPKARFSLLADVRNQDVSDPTFQGAQQLQSGFIKAVELLEL